MRPTRAVIDLGALTDNFGLVKRLAPRRRVLAVVKADAYGHGAVPVARRLADLGTDGLAVATIEEALALREAGIQTPIVLLEGFFETSEIAEMAAWDLEPVLGDADQIERFLAHPPSRPLRVWLKLDSGMHRLGLGREAYRTAFGRLDGHPGVSSLVAMSHLAAADHRDHPSTDRQLGLCDEVFEDLDSPVSLANSAGILAWPASRRDWVRPGLMLYGLSPFQEPLPEAEALRPVMTLRSVLSSIREVPAGEGIGYGHRWICRERTRIGVVPLGYGDGYPREAPDGTPVVVDGRPTRVLGQPSMDMITVDLGPVADARIGSPVELWGEKPRATEVARVCGTIPYTLVTGVTKRVPRDYGASGSSNSRA